MAVEDGNPPASPPPFFVGANGLKAKRANRNGLAQAAQTPAQIERGNANTRPTEAYLFMPNAIALRRLKWYDGTAADDRGNVMQSFDLNRKLRAGLICLVLAILFAGAQIPTAAAQSALERIQEELKKRADEANKKLREDDRLDEAPAARPLEGFCKALEDVIAVAPDDFKPILGPLEYSFYAVRLSIPGSGKCNVPIDTGLGYSCSADFKTAAIASQQLSALARNIDKCLPGVKAERSADHYSITLWPEDRRTRGSIIMISIASLYKKWLDGTDTYYVTLSVLNLKPR